MTPLGRHARCINLACTADIGGGDGTCARLERILDHRQQGSVPHLWGCLLRGCGHPALGARQDTKEVVEEKLVKGVVKGIERTGDKVIRARTRATAPHSVQEPQVSHARARMLFRVGRVAGQMYESLNKLAPTDEQAHTELTFDPRESKARPSLAC